MSGPAGKRPEPATPPPGGAGDARPAPPFTLVRALAAITALIGVVMIVLAFVGGGGIGSYGVLVGAFFVAAGVMRLRLVHLRAKADR